MVITSCPLPQNAAERLNTLVSFQPEFTPLDGQFSAGANKLEIEREGDEIRIRPARRSLSGVLSKFAKFSPEFMEEGRGDQEQRERDAL